MEIWKFSHKYTFYPIRHLVSFCASKIHHIDIKTTHHYEKCLDINQYFLVLS